VLRTRPGRRILGQVFCGDVLPGLIERTLPRHNPKDWDSTKSRELLRSDASGESTKATIPPTGAPLSCEAPRYAAPAMFAKKNSGADSANLAANVYALGMLFYEILLGRTLFAKNISRTSSLPASCRAASEQDGRAPATENFTRGPHPKRSRCRVRRVTGA
jgi:hypothetical protein